MILVAMLLAGVMAGWVMGAAWAIRTAPFMEDEPSNLDLMDKREDDQ